MKKKRGKKGKHHFVTKRFVTPGKKRNCTSRGERTRGHQKERRLAISAAVEKKAAHRMKKRKRGKRHAA